MQKYVHSAIFYVIGIEAKVTFAINHEILWKPNNMHLNWVLSFNMGTIYHGSNFRLGNWHDHQINILFQYIVIGMLRFLSLHHFEAVLLFKE